MNKSPSAMASGVSYEEDVAPLDDGLTDDELQEFIATAAYYRAQERGFEPGQELEDWLAAESLIRSKRMLNPGA